VWWIIALSGGRGGGGVCEGGGCSIEDLRWV